MKDPVNTVIAVAHQQTFFSSLFIVSKMNQCMKQNLFKTSFVTSFPSFMSIFVVVQSNLCPRRKNNSWTLWKRQLKQRHDTHSTKTTATEVIISWDNKRLMTSSLTRHDHQTRQSIIKVIIIKLCSDSLWVIYFLRNTSLSVFLFSLSFFSCVSSFLPLTRHLCNVFPHKTSLSFKGNPFDCLWSNRCLCESFTSEFTWQQLFSKMFSSLQHSLSVVLLYNWIQCHSLSLFTNERCYTNRYNTLLSFTQQQIQIHCLIHDQTQLHYYQNKLK